MSDAHASAEAASPQQLKTRARRRLIGAAVLVAVAAAVLPLALDQEPPPMRDLDVKLAPSDDGFTSRIVPAPPAAAPQLSEPPPTRGEDRAAPEQKKAAAPDAAKAPPAATAASNGRAVRKEAAPEPAAGSGGRYVVQLAALSSDANVRQLRQKLSAAGIKSYTEKLKTANGEATRVRVGPFGSREAALRMQERLKGMGISGTVAPQ